MTTAYLAAQYGRRAEIAGYAAQLRGAGWTVTSRWLLGPDVRSLPDGTTLSAHAEWLVERPFDTSDGLRIGNQCAQQDIEDVQAAEVLVLFTGGGLVGRHVEFGVALALGARLVIVGQRENVFHAVDGVEVYPTWAEAFTVLVSQAVAS